jgi:hypothetical protein
MDSERKQVVYAAFDSLQSILGANDFGQCDECGWAVFSSGSETKRGLPKSRLLEICSGFDENGKPVGGTRCLLVKHQEYIQRSGSG